MHYLSSYYWRQGEENTSSLVLLQAYHKKKEVPVLLACVCEEDSPETNLNSQYEQEERRRDEIEQNGCFADKLKEWFYDTGLPLGGGGDVRGWKMAVKSLEKLLKRTMRRGQRLACNDAGGRNVGFTGIWCVGNRFLQFSCNRGRLFLLNARNGKPHCQEMYGGMYGNRYSSQSGALFLEQGIMQEGIGILLATEGFATDLTEASIVQQVHVRKLYEYSCLGGQVVKQSRKEEETEYVERRMRECLEELGKVEQCKDCRNAGAVFLYIGR